MSPPIPNDHEKTIDVPSKKNGETSRNIDRIPLDDFHSEWNVNSSSIERLSIEEEI